MSDDAHPQEALGDLPQSTQAVETPIHSQQPVSHIQQRQRRSGSPSSAGFDFAETPSNNIQNPPSATPTSHAPQPVLSEPSVTALSTDNLSGVAEPEDALSNNSEASLATPTLKLTLLCTTGARVLLALDKQFIEDHSLPVKDAESINVGQFKKLIYDEWMNAQKQAELGGGDTEEAELTDSEDLKATKNFADATAAKTLSNTPTDDTSNDKTQTKNWGAVLAASVPLTPFSPDHIRLIHLGKVLVDEYTLEDYKITAANSFNVMHLSVRPENTGKEKSGRKSRVKTGLTGSGNTSGGAGGNGVSRLMQSSSRGDAGAGDANAQEQHHRSGCCIIC